jgi:NADH-quinone oxidoreductase subunit J
MSTLPYGGLVAFIVFGIIAAVAMGSALAVVTRRSPISAIAWLVVHFVATACAYILLASQFIAAVQVLVYAGAIMVLFLFVIMLLGLDKDGEPGAASGLGRKVLVITLALVLVTLVGKIAGAPGQPGGAGGGASVAGAAELEAGVEDSVEWLAANLLSKHVVAFEVASIILIAAMAGVMVYTTRRGPQAPGATEGGLP